MTPLPDRVAYLVNQYPKVSHTFIRREIHALERQGFEVVRLAVRGWDDAPPDAQDRDEQSRTRYLLQGGAGPLLAAGARAAFASPLRFARALGLALRLGRRADRPRPIHLVYLAEACLALRWLRAAGIRHVHAHFGTNSTEVALLVRALGGPGYSFTVHGPEEFDKPEFLHLGEKIRRARFVVAITSYCRSQLYRCLDSADWTRVRLVRCGLERAFHQLDVRPPEGRSLVCVGRFSEQKGLPVLIEAAVLAWGRGADFELVLVGDGELRPVIEARLRDERWLQRVRITGWVGSDRVRAEILRARALVTASFAEGLPVVLMEAMALRRPVLATAIAGVPELVRPGVNGWLCPAGDAPALATAIEDCLACPPNRLAEMGEAAYRDVLERHDIDVEANRLGIHFREALQRA